MIKFTIFTLLYLATGVCFTIFAFHQGSTNRLFSGIIMDAYLAFFYTFVSILPWWRQRLVRIQIKLLHRPGWQRAIYDSWIAIVLMLILITQLVAYGLSTQTIAQFGLLFLVIVISIEGFWVRQQL